MRCKCNNIIPDGRLRLGYRTCVNCSTTQLYSYIPIIANKQVLEVQIVSQELSAAVHKSWRKIESRQLVRFGIDVLRNLQ
jgi:hypothetical protein